MPFPGILFQILIGIILVAAVLYLLSLVPTNPSNAWLIQAARVIVVVFVIIWLLSLLFGLLGGVASPYPYRLR